jgi:hypothetical protein
MNDDSKQYEFIEEPNLETPDKSGEAQIYSAINYDNHSHYKNRPSDLS